MPEAPLVELLPAPPRKFVLDLLRLVPDLTPEETRDTMRGVGDHIRDVAPVLLWKILGALPPRADRVPSVQILTDEPAVPWELALIDVDELRDPNAPPFLGAQYEVGRWTLARQRPTTPPPSECRQTPMTVFLGKYEGARWRALPEAQEEADALATLYQASMQQSNYANVVKAFNGQSVPEVVHFALHGQYGGGEGGLILGDKETLRPLSVRGLRFTSKPFVFLNACEAGVSEPTLSLFTGLPGAMLVAGASAVVAPLWKVNDGIAKEVALHFYAGVTKGLTAGAALRNVRRAFSDQPHTTHLAYQLFGDPNVRFK
ncbi:MAG: CHAT domain-containing protein [Nannocystales bacterium]